MQLLIIRPWRMSYKSLKGYSNIEYDFSMWATRRPNIGLCLLQSNNEQKKRKKIKQFSSSCTCVQEWESRWTYCSSGSIMIITGCPELPFSLLLLLLSSRKNYYFFCFQEIFFCVCFLLKRGSNYYWLYCFHTQTHRDTTMDFWKSTLVTAHNCTTTIRLAPADTSSQRIVYHHFLSSVTNIYWNMF
jgi:hypothetical protein